MEKLLILIFYLFFPQLLFAGNLMMNFNIIWGIPFCIIILLIAFFPLINSKIWHLYYGRITFFIVFIFLLNLLYFKGLDVSVDLVMHSILVEYLPFIILLLSLYTVSGGILFVANIPSTPINNVFILLFGSILASLIGTTGAAILLIRPLLHINQNRIFKVHLVIFLIFLVGNIGGGLTPIGDPPLFLGFLNGVSFFWTLKSMFLPVFMNIFILLVIFYFIDRYFYLKEDIKNKKNYFNKDTYKIKIYGKFNFFLILFIIFSVLLTSLWDSKINFNIFNFDINLSNIVSNLLLIIITITSLLFTKKQIRWDNQFNWEPIKEVAILFLGIFITIIPIIALLKMGLKGDMGFLMKILYDANNEPINSYYFWITGVLSSILDNAPTYLVFFNLAGGDANILMNNIPKTLQAVSMGSVFMGALTYIGNAPNFMVKSVAENRNIKMPTFFGYMKWSLILLIPLYLLQTLLFF